MTKKKSKDLDYYMNLPFTIEIVAIPDSEGGGFAATLPEIGRDAITGDGDSPEEAIRDLRQAMRTRFTEYLGKGIEIPEPTPSGAFSGRFVLRIPPRFG